MADKKAAPQTEKKAAAPAAAAPAAGAAAAAPAAAAPAAAASSSESPLETPWTLWYDKKLSREQLAAQQSTGAQGFTHYAQNLQKVGMFDTVQGFWHHYSHMQQPDAIPKDHNLYMFRGSAVPAWETFPHGGCWILKVRKHNGVINRLWEELCFASIGEWWADPDVVGVTLSTRAKDDSVMVWCGTSNTKSSIGEKLKEILNLDETSLISWQSFKTAMSTGSSVRGAQDFTFAPANPQQQQQQNQNQQAAQ